MAKRKKLTISLDRDEEEEYDEEDDDMLTHCECRRCGHKWEARRGKPASCPRCKSYQWEKAAGLGGGSVIVSTGESESSGDHHLHRKEAEKGAGVGTKEGNNVNLGPEWVEEGPPEDDNFVETRKLEPIYAAENPERYREDQERAREMERRARLRGSGAGIPIQKSESGGEAAASGFRLASKDPAELIKMAQNLKGGKA